MAILNTRPDFTQNFSATTAKLLNSITAKTIWGETDLQYYFGSRTALALDSEFGEAFTLYLSGRPDDVFAFENTSVRAYEMIDAVSALDFTRTTDTSVADHVLVSADRPVADIEGFFEFPGSSYRGPASGGDSWSIGTLNSGYDFMMAPAEMGGGDYANWTVLHEIGHGLGLKHTHNDNTGLPLATIGAFLNDERYSVMSYNTSSWGEGYGHAVSFMALDIAAIQALYGAEAYAKGNSTYEFSNARAVSLDLTEGDVEIGRAYYCIWDSSGTDTIRYSTGSKDKPVLINLNDATLDTSGIGWGLKTIFASLERTAFFKNLSDSLQQEIVDQWHHAGGFFSRVLGWGGGKLIGAEGGYSIANGVMIENAVGGSRADLLIGNEGANKLMGLEGNDTLISGQGADRLWGGAGNDLLDGGQGNDILIGGAGADRFVFSKNHGTDRIRDFAADDVIDLTRLWGLKSHEDLFDLHMKDVGDDVRIQLGNDVLIIEGRSKADLNHDDFLV